MLHTCRAVGPIEAHYDIEVNVIQAYYSYEQGAYFCVYVKTANGKCDNQITTGCR